MTNREVYDIGRIIETFNYINQYDPYNTYIGYLVKVDNTVYEIVVNQHNMLVDPDEKASIFRMEDSPNEKRLIETMNVSMPFNQQNDVEDMFSFVDENDNVVEPPKIKVEEVIDPNLVDFNRPW
jgi:hypothetical protein